MYVHFVASECSGILEVNYAKIRRCRGPGKPLPAGRNAATNADQRNGLVNRNLRYQRQTGGGPPPHTHQWEEVYFVLSGEMDVHIDGATTRFGLGGIIHVPAGVPHGYTTVDETHFLTIVTKGNAAKFFKQAATEIEMNPPDVAGVLRVGAEHGITFLV